MLEKVFRWVFRRVDFFDVQVLYRVNYLCLVLDIYFRKVTLTLSIFEGRLKIHVINLVLAKFVFHIVQVIILHTICHLKEPGDLQWELLRVRRYFIQQLWVRTLCLFHGFLCLRLLVQW